MAKTLVDFVLMLGWIVAFFVPTLVVAWMIVRRKREYEAEAEEPFTDLPMQLPGESTRKRAEGHWDKAMEWFLLLAGASAFFGFAVTWMAGRQQVIGAVVFGVIIAVLAFVAVPRVMKSLQEYWNAQLGFKGERVVAEELNQLLALGWRVFHDVSFNGFNVDHIAVGPVGVFAVETKAKRKWKERATAHPAHMLKWDGRQITWPSGKKNDFGVAQADRNARTVAEFLSKSTGEPVICQPVLTLPGWWVELEGRGGVIVASTKGLHKVLLKCGCTPLNPARIQQIAFQLEQKCKPERKPE